MKTIRNLLTALVVAGAIYPLQALCQAPDLTTNQTVGVTESKFFYLGPTGMKGWMYTSDLTRDARQILVTEVREGTPSDGVLEYHDVILGIDGGLFTNGARTAFCEAVTDAEATGNGGELYLTVFRPSIAETNALVATNTLMVQLQEMGSYSPTTPYDCPKVDAMLTNFCEYVYNNGPVGGSTPYPSIWAMLASGVPKYVDWGCDFITNQSYAARTTLSVYKDSIPVWYTSYQLVTLCQYYLLTTNAAVLPSIADLANYIAEGQDLHGLWGHTMAYPSYNGGELHGTLPGYGALNQAGLVALYGLALAQNCGVTNDVEVNTAVDKAANFFRANMYLGAINYGFNPPVDSVTDSNGRMGIAAHIFRALGDPEAAKWFAMMTSTYGWRDWGHTGNEFNHCWGPMGASVGGQPLANFVQTRLSRGSRYWRISLTMRRQPEGTFKSQGQGAQGDGRQSSGISGGHATGGYACQLAAGHPNVELTGAGYSTNDYWLTASEMDELIFARDNEGTSVAGYDAYSTAYLMTNLSVFCPKVSTRIADNLGSRIAADPELMTNLISIVEDSGALEHERAMALRALKAGGTNILVKTTSDAWFYPSQGYVLNWAAAKYGAGSDDVTTWTNVLAAIVQFDKDVGFDMLTAQQYAAFIRYMDPDLLDQTGLDLYYDAAGYILDPDVGSGAWVTSQDVKNWDPLVIARYADKILRSAEQFAQPYDALTVMENNQIGEGLHSVATRVSVYGDAGGLSYGPKIDPGWVNEYGEHWGHYEHYTRAIQRYYAHNRNYINMKYVADFTVNQAAPPVQWFRDLIATNIANTVTNPATELADLRYNMTVGEDDDLFHAVCLEKIVSHPDNADPFVDITNAVGSTVPNVASHWRLYAGAVELGVADTNAVDRWLAALSQADTDGNVRLAAGILHVLAGKAAPGALTAAMAHLTHDSDYVAMAALDVLASVGTKDELLTVFDNYLTNSTLIATSEDGTDTSLGLKDEYWFDANWQAITNIVGRDYAGCLALADQLATSFNAFTDSGASLASVPGSCTAHTPPFSILTPVLSERPILGFENGIYAVLGLFAGDNAACQDALVSVLSQTSGSGYGIGPNFCAGKASLTRFSIPEIVAIENSGGTNLWNERAAMFYLLHGIFAGDIAVSNQLDAFYIRDGKFLTGNANYYGTSWQRELTYRRGLQETEGVFFYFAD